MDHLRDEFSLRLLRYLVSGAGVRVNINSLAKELGMHRTTIKTRLDSLFENHMLARPRYPFMQLFQEYPLLILALADIPRIPQAQHFFEDDSHIFAAYTCREGDYNTMMIEFFKDMESYHSWREKIVSEEKLPKREGRATADVFFFSNRLCFKYDPACFVEAMGRAIAKDGSLNIKGQRLDHTDFKILDSLAHGRNVCPVETFLAKELGTNRKKVQRRTEALLGAGIIDSPRCHFPELLAPPGYNLIITLLEIKSRKAQIKQDILANNFIPRALESSIGRYNTLIFSAYPTIDDFFEWSEAIADRYPDCIGAMSNFILSSRPRHVINPQKVSLGLIERNLWEIKTGISAD
jgi:DNA-binding Lrp family transcriptional regulator